MPNPQPPLVHGKYFHIYIRGINGSNLFAEPKNYEYFLSLYDKYISEIARTYAWVLMPNHFHLLVKIMDEPEIGFNPNKRIIKEEKSRWVEKQSMVSTSDFDQNEDFTFEKYKPEISFLTFLMPMLRHSIENITGQEVCLNIPFIGKKLILSNISEN